MTTGGTSRYVEMFFFVLVGGFFGLGALGWLGAFGGLVRSGGAVSFFVFSLFLRDAACFTLSGVASDCCGCAATTEIVKIARSKVVRTFMPVSREKVGTKIIPVLVRRSVVLV